MTFLLKKTNEVFQIHWKLLTIDLMVPIVCWVHKIIKWKPSWYSGWGFRWTARRLTFCHKLVSLWESHKSFRQYKNGNLKWQPFVTGKFSKPNDNLYIPLKPIYISSKASAGILLLIPSLLIRHIFKWNKEKFTQANLCRWAQGIRVIVVSHKTQV